MASRREPRAYGTASSPPDGLPFDSYAGSPETRITMFSPEQAASGANGMNDLYATSSVSAMANVSSHATMPTYNVTYGSSYAGPSTMPPNHSMPGSGNNYAGRQVIDYSGNFAGGQAHYYAGNYAGDQGGYYDGHHVGHYDGDYAGNNGSYYADNNGNQAGFYAGHQAGNYPVNHGSHAGPSTLAGPSYGGRQYEYDPFYDPRGSLSATASTFHPAATASKGKASAAFYPEGSPTVANVLSHEMEISFRIEVCDTPAPSIQDVGTFLNDLIRKGARTFGSRNLEASDGHIYVCFEDIRDAIWAFTTIRKAKKGWLSVYMKINRERLDNGIVRFSELRQLDLEVTIANFAIIDPGHVDEIVQRVLNGYGQLFAMVRVVSLPDGSFRGVAQFCKAADAHYAYQAFNCYTMNGVIVTLKKPQDACASTGVNSLIGGLQGLSVQDAGNRYQQTALYEGPSYSGSMFAGTRTPQGNPFAAPGAYQLPAPPVHQPFVPPTPAMTAQNSLMHSRNNSFGFGNRGGFGRFDSRRNQMSRYGRGPRGLNNVVDLEELVAGRDVRTTIMLRNIPNKVDQPLLKRIVDASSFGKYDFMYLRIDFANDCNVGYAFINFVKAEYIIDFVEARANKRWNCFKSDKVAEVSYATIQGKDCLVQKFRNSSVMLEAEHYRPKLFYTVHSEDTTLIGEEEPFPGPDNQSKMRRSVENAEHVGLFTPTAGAQFRDEQRRRHSQYDRGTRLAALEEISYENSLGPYYGHGMYHQ
ncbi:hypothetical protein ACHAPU_010547 [Fusarium lateritium]